MRKDFRDMLNDPHKQIDGATGPLSRLFRKIIFDRGIGAREMEHLLQRYIDEEQRKTRKTTFDKSSTWNNLAKALVDPERMSWKTLQTAFKIFRLPRVKIVVIPTWPNGSESQHAIEITFTKKAEPAPHIDQLKEEAK